jgi:GNAT superfamily N-acetyltransferase
MIVVDEKETMNTILEDFSPSAVVAAMEANAQEQVLLWGKAIGAEIHNDAGVKWFVSGIPFALCNGIVDAQFSPQQPGDSIDAILAHIASYHVPMICVITPSMRPLDLAQHLQQHGWELSTEDPAMALDLHKLSPVLLPHDVQIQIVEDETALKEMIRVLIIGSDLPEEAISLLLDLYNQRGFPRHPSLRFYLALLDNEAVATGTLFLGGGVAGIYNVATLEHARHRGIGTAITATGLHEARKQGYRIGILESSPMGLNVYRHLGFQAYSTFNFFFHG